MNIRVELLALELVSGLRKKWNDCRARVSADDCDVLVGWVGLLELGDESGSPDNVKSGNTKETLWIVDTLGLEDLGSDWDGRVDWIGNDEDVGLWGVLSSSLGEVADDGSIGVE